MPGRPLPRTRMAPCRRCSSRPRRSRIVGRLEGKVALISGTGGGQGRAAALRFAREGAKVFGCDLNAAAQHETIALLRDEGLDMAGTGSVDLGDPQAAQAWIEDAVATYGRIDI